MKEEIKINEVIICTIALLLLITAFEIFLAPKINIKTDFISKAVSKIFVRQNISPQRLFINVWRTAKNSYADSSMNHQNWNRWRAKYLKHIKTMEDADTAINTMLLSLNDPYTRFLRSELFAKQKTIMDAKITGIGIIFNKSGNNLVINSVLENSPAEEADIKPGDTIISIDGKKADAQAAASLINDIQNGRNGTVEIILKRNNIIVSKKIQKKEIPVKTMDYKITDDNIGIIKLSSLMGSGAVLNFIDILVKTNKTKAVILDLRNNFGGIAANAFETANYMMDSAEIAGIKSGSGRIYHIYSADERIFTKKPVIILINRKTASAAEILAGALKIQENAVLIGENSYGKNSIQQVIPMHNKSGLIITTDKYILPDGSDIYNTGLQPDIYIKQLPGFKDMQMETALQTARKITAAENAGKIVNKI